MPKTRGTLSSRSKTLESLFACVQDKRGRTIPKNVPLSTALLLSYPSRNQDHPCHAVLDNQFIASPKSLGGLPSRLHPTPWQCLCAAHSVPCAIPVLLPLVVPIKRGIQRQPNAPLRRLVRSSRPPYRCGLAPFFKDLCAMVVSQLKRP